jgi:hypothetical protein
MAFNLFGSVAVALAVALVIFFIRRHLFPGLPRWLMPATAGIAMIAFGIWNSYAWYGRVTSYLTDGWVVAHEMTTRSPIEPWTYAVERVEGFAAVNTASVRSNPDHPNVVLAEVATFVRFRDTLTRNLIFDCRRGLVGDPPAALAFDEAGNPAGIEWHQGASAEALVETVCTRG